MECGMDNGRITSSPGCLQIQTNKFPDLQDTLNKVPAGFFKMIETRKHMHFQLCTILWIKLHKRWSYDSFSDLKDVTRFGPVNGILSYSSWQLNFPGASIKFQEISRSCRQPGVAAGTTATLVKFPVAENHRCYDRPRVDDDARPARCNLHPHCWFIHGEIQVWLRPTSNTTRTVYKNCCHYFHLTKYLLFI